jgi:hypothetical protein
LSGQNVFGRKIFCNGTDFLGCLAPTGPLSPESRRAGLARGNGFERIAAEIWITNQSKSPRKFSAYEIAIQVWDNSAQMTIDPESFA